MNSSEGLLSASSEKKDEIMKAAAALFCRQGFKETSMKDIAKAVGLPPGGLYYYIKSKEELLFDITIKGINMLLPGLQEIARSKLSTREKFREAVRWDVKILAQSKDYIATYQSVKTALSPEHYKEYKEYKECRDSVEHIFRNIIRDGIKEGIFRDQDIHLTVFSVLGMCNITQWFSPNRNLTVEQIADFYTDAAERLVLKK